MNNKSIDEKLKNLVRQREENEYCCPGIKIGVTSNGFIDREAHRTFVKNIFETSPYSCNQD